MLLVCYQSSVERLTTGQRTEGSLASGRGAQRRSHGDTETQTQFRTSTV